MIATAQEYYKSLGIPHRTVSIVAGALNDAAAKKMILKVGSQVMELIESCFMFKLHRFLVKRT